MAQNIKTQNSERRQNLELKLWQKKPVVCTTQKVYKCQKKCWAILDDFGKVWMLLSNFGQF